MRRFAVCLLASSLALAGCGDDSSSSISKTDPTTTTEATDPAQEVPTDVCDDFYNGIIGDEFVDSVPSGHDAALDTVIALAELSENIGSDESFPAADFAEILSGDDTAGELESFAEVVGDMCGSDSGELVESFALAATIIHEDRNAEYCAVLDETAGGPSAMAEEPDIGVADLEGIAPQSHLTALESLEAGGSESGAFALMAIGVYAEVTCEIVGAADYFMFLAAFAGAGSMGTDTGNGSDNAATVPDPADASAANTAAAGAITFEVQELALEDDEFHVSAVVPVGWEFDDFMGSEFSPSMSEGWSIFAQMRLNAGCDGGCQATDWEDRLLGPDGYVTSYLSQRSDATQRAVEGSEGLVVLSPSDFSALVVRWDDSADRYFSCEITLDEEHGALLDAFVVACESTTVGWIARSS